MKKSTLRPEETIGRLKRASSLPPQSTGTGSSLPDPDFQLHVAVHFIPAEPGQLYAIFTASLEGDPPPSLDGDELQRRCGQLVRQYTTRAIEEGSGGALSLGAEVEASRGHQA